MNFKQLRSRVLPSSTKAQRERRDYAQGPESASGGSGSWRRKSAIVAAVVGAAMYLRRKRSRSADTAEAGETEQREETSKSGGLGRRLVMMVASTVAFAVVRRLVRRFTSKK